MKPLAPRERRLIAFALLLAAVLLAWWGIIWPVVSGFQARAVERRMLAATYLRDQRLIAALPSWRAADIAQRASAGRFAIAAPSEQLGVEILEERIQHVAADEGFAVSSIQDLQGDAAGGTIKVRADMQLTLAQLSDSLRRLESEGAYVVVDYLSITADRAALTGRLAPLDVRLELTSAYVPTVQHLS